MRSPLNQQIPGTEEKPQCWKNISRISNVSLQKFAMEKAIEAPGVAQSKSSTPLHSSRSHAPVNPPPPPPPPLPDPDPDPVLRCPVSAQPPSRSSGNPLTFPQGKNPRTAKPGKPHVKPGPCAAPQNVSSHIWRSSLRPSPPSDSPPRSHPPPASSPHPPPAYSPHPPTGPSHPSAPSASS